MGNMMKHLVTKAVGHEDNIRLLSTRHVQKDPAEEGRLRQHAAHQQPPQVQKGQRNLPASRIPNTMRTTWTGKAAILF